jgi:hypothetical protein
MWGNSSVHSVHIVVRPEKDKQTFNQTLILMFRWLKQDAKVNRVTFEIDYGGNNPLPDWFFQLLTSLVNYLNSRCNVQAEITNIKPNINLQLEPDNDLDESLEEMAVAEDLPVLIREIPDNWFNTVPQFVKAAILEVLPDLWGHPFDPTQRVPMVHSFPNSISYYDQFRHHDPENHNINAFIIWLQNNFGFAAGGAAAIAWPLKLKNLNVVNCSDAEVSDLNVNPRQVFAQNFLYGWHRVNPNIDLPRNIADVFIVGHLNGVGGGAATQQIINWGCTDMPNAARAILDVGRHMGKHFGWLDDQYMRTNFFVEYFIPRIKSISL